MSVFIHKSKDPTWPKWAVTGKEPDTRWFDTQDQAESFAGFKYVEPSDSMFQMANRNRRVVDAALKVMEAHDADAKTKNFTVCGCDWCSALRPLVKGQTGVIV